MFHCNRVSISSHFRDNGPQIHWGHDLYLYRSRDVTSRDQSIRQVTNRSAICHFLLVSHCNRTSISNRFRDIWLPNPVHTHRQTENTHRHAPQVILYSVTCNVLHWTDKNIVSEMTYSMSNGTLDLTQLNSALVCWWSNNCKVQLFLWYLYLYSLVGVFDASAQ